MSRFYMSKRLKARIRMFHVKHPEVTTKNLAIRFHTNHATIWRVLHPKPKPQVSVALSGPGVANVTKVTYAGRPVYEVR